MILDLLARRIRELRKKRGLTQEEVARKLGISRQAYIRLEAGNRNISLREVYELAKIFEVDFRQITDVGPQAGDDVPSLVAMCRNENLSDDAEECIKKVQDILEHFAAQERLYLRMTGGDR